MNSFFASVELLDYPEFKDLPVAVCGDPKSRQGIILAKNESAKSQGVVTAETLQSALRKCPSLKTIKPHHEKYRLYSKKINEIYYQYTDKVEPFSIDESWLDVTASQTLFGTGEKIANDIRMRVKKELGLTLSAGVSYNKIFAKMGSEYKKPDATTVITRENFKGMLWDMDVSELFFVGFATSQKFHDAGIRTIGDLATADSAMLKTLVGKQGPVLQKYALGMDESPVEPFNQKRKVKSIGNGITFKRNLTSREDVLVGVTALSYHVAERLRRHEMKAMGVKVDIRNPRFQDISRQRQVSIPTASGAEIKNIAISILDSEWSYENPIRLLTVTAINLVSDLDPMQLSFFDANKIAQVSKSDQNTIGRAIDEINKKYGKGAIQPASSIKNDLGIDF